MSDKTGSHLALEDRILWALEPDEAGPLHMAKLRAWSSQQAKAIRGEHKHPSPWKVFGGENTEAILDGNGDVVVQARPLEGGRAVLDFGSEDARRMVLDACEWTRPGRCIGNTPSRCPYGGPNTPSSCCLPEGHDGGHMRFSRNTNNAGGNG